MKVKVDVRELQAGMYVAELDRPWLETPFLFQGFELRNEDERKMLERHCRYVYVDVHKSPTFTPKYFDGARMAFSQRLAREDDEIKRKIREIVHDKPQVLAPHRKPYIDEAPFEQEIVEAKVVEKETRAAMDEALENVEKGKRFDLPLAQRAVGKMVESVIRNPDALICLSQLKDVNKYTALHSIRTSIIALAFGRHMALSRDELNILGLGVLMHDVGMARVPKAILDKPSGLSSEEFAIMAKHIKWGLEILETSGGVPAGAQDVVRQHHERGEGHGYPNHLKAPAIAPAGLIGAIVDVYDAVTSDRHYGVAMSAEDALKRMYEWRHKDFSAPIVEDFIRCMGIFPIGSLVELSNGSVGVVITINRARRLKPKVALVLTATKTPYSQRIVTDLLEAKDAYGNELKITRVLPSGSYDINPMDHLVQF
jgi:HD-GYP domain-containing protein (c-di-GMP phosphodiesterase class II)